MFDRRNILLKLFKGFDLVVLVGCFGLATWFSFYWQNERITFQEFLSVRIKIQNLLLFLALIGTWHLVFSGFKLYHSRRLTGMRREVLDLLKAITLGTLLVATAAILVDLTMITPPFLVFFWTLTSLVLIFSRFTLRRFLSWVRLNNKNIRYMLIVGTNGRAVRFAEKVESRPELGYRLLGFVENGWKDNQEFLKTGYPVVSDFRQFPSFLRENVVDEVVICLPIKSFYDRITTIAKLCEEQGIITRYLSNIFDLKLAHSSIESFAGEPFVAHYTGSMMGRKVLIKRAIDIVISSVLLFTLAPLFAAAAFIIKLTSPGPVFFIQERVGLNKRRFRLYKFRTMVPDAEKRQAELENLNEVSGPVFKIKDDPRITPIGKLLRKTSIDEIPQFYNVLKGDMSLVGPRALPLRDYNGFSQDWHRRRFSVRPGITCLWQVNGRSAIQFDQWMGLDMEYIDQWSLWLDLRILFRTIPAVLRGSGAA